MSIIFGVFLTGILFLVMQARVWPRNVKMQLGYVYQPWHFAIMIFICGMIPMMISKFALAQILLFCTICLLFGSFEYEIFTPPYYDSVQISNGSAPRLLKPFEYWLIILWSLPNLFLSFYLSSKYIVRNSSFIVISNFTSVIDMVTDILVVYTWMIDDHFCWAIFQLSFVVMGQFYSALMIFYTNINDKKSYFDIIEIVITMCGFGKLWYGAKTLKNSQAISFFKKLKIWEIIFESFPSAVLAFFISIAQNELYSRSVLLSFIVSFLNISMTVMLIMFKDRCNINCNNDQMYNFNKDVDITS